MNLLKKILLSFTVAALILTTACGAGGGDSSEKKGPETTTQSAKEQKAVMEEGERFLKGKHYFDDVTDYEIEDNDLKLASKAYFDIDKDGVDELIVKLTDKGSDSDAYFISYNVYRYNDSEFSLAFRIPYYPQGEDGLLYYNADEKSVAVHVGGDECHWTYFWKIRNDTDALKSVGYQDDMEAEEPVRHFYQCRGMFNYEVENIYEHYANDEFASYRLDDKDSVKKEAEEALASYIGELTEIPFEKVSEK